MTSDPTTTPAPEPDPASMRRSTARIAQLLIALYATFCSAFIMLRWAITQELPSVSFELLPWPS